MPIDRQEVLTALKPFVRAACMTWPTIGDLQTLRAVFRKLGGKLS